MPTFAAGLDGQQNPIRLKNLLREAEEELCRRGSRSTEARRLVEPVRQLVEDKVFWLEQNKGLAVFVSADTMRAYRLPLALEELHLVSQRFHIKPLLPLLDGDDRYYVLAVSKNRTRLFQGHRARCQEIPVEGLPENMQAALQYDRPQEGSQAHSAMQPSQGRPKKQTAVVHGQGGKRDSSKDELKTYCRMIDAAVHGVLNGQQAPLFLACVDAVVPTYRDVNSYAHLADEFIKGNSDYVNAAELHAAAWSLMEKQFTKRHHISREQYTRLQGSGRTSEDLDQIVPASLEGNIEILFVVADAHRWGTFDEATSKLHVHAQRHADDDDLLDLACSQTLLHRGTVHAVRPQEMPGKNPAAAILRRVS
jgi:hypothetical protein